MSLTFCGASVTSINSSLGWNDQISQLTVGLVEDDENGDIFNPPLVGTPATFVYENFEFQGLLQSWQRTKSPEGLPLYQTVVQDPREILDGVQIITGGYRGVITVKNVLNAFGYLENFGGFGFSGSNQAGMPWYKVLQALNVLSNLLIGDYGTAISYRGILYSVDLSELPVPPIYYRVATPSISLREIINQICLDGGCDYFVELDGFTIKIRTTSRLGQPEIGTIAAITDLGYGVDLARSDNGLEARNEVSGAFIVGGQQTNLYQASTLAIQPFWGLDIDGDPILGTGTGDDHTALLNAAEIASILGDTTYQCNVLEMRCALVNYQTWAAYMVANKPALSAQIGLISPFAIGITQKLFPKDGINDAAQNAALNGIGQVVAATYQFNMAVYEFVRKVASEFMGKKFLVGVPFLLQYIDAESLQVVNSYEVANDGAFVEDGETPLGMPPANQDQFKTGDSRFFAFARYSDVSLADLSRINPADVTIGGAGLFQKIAVDTQMFFVPEPAVIVTMSSPIFDVSPDALGNTAVLASLFGTNVQSIENMRTFSLAGSFPLKIHPAARQPDFVAIPLKSNILTYGPWYAQGAPGKVNFTYDPDLVPWNYGGYTYMNLAGNARVAQSITNQLFAESGTVELAGPPQFKLGDLLQGAGPNITNIEVGYGENGIRTKYSMRTFTPAFGMFAKTNSERIRKIGQQNVEMRRAVRAAINKKATALNIATAAFGPNWLERMPGFMKNESPHTCLSAVVNSGATPRLQVSSCTFEESIAGCGAHDPVQFRNTAVMSLNGLVRPFSTAYVSGANSNIPCLTAPTGLGITSANYNPFATPNDMEWYTWGNTYDRLNATAGSPDANNSRLLALRGPLMVCGWGHKINTAPISEAGLLTDFRGWKTGPVDLLWDNYRGVWTSHDIQIGNISGSIAAGASGPMNLDYGLGTSPGQIIVNNYFTTDITVPNPPLKVIAGYTASVNKWYIIAADCIPSG